MFSIIPKKQTLNQRSLGIALKCLRFTAYLIELCHQYGILYSLENPQTSKMFRVAGIQRALQHTGAIMVEFDCCRYGCPYRKRTLLATNCSVLSALGKRCCFKLRQHEHLRGGVKILDDSGKTLQLESIGSVVKTFCSALLQVLASEMPESLPF